MTKEQAVEIWIAFGSARVDAQLREGLPQRVVDRALQGNAEDCIDGLIALGLLHVDAEQSA